MSTSTVILTSKKNKTNICMTSHAKIDEDPPPALSCLVLPLQGCTDSVHQSGTIWNQSFGSGRCHKPDTSRDKARLCSATGPEHRNCKMQYESLITAWLVFHINLQASSPNANTRFCSWFWHAVLCGTPSHCTHRCSFPKARSFQGDPHTGHVGSNSHYRRPCLYPGNPTKRKSFSLSDTYNGPIRVKTSLLYPPCC